MSTLIADLEVFSYVRQGLMKIAFNTEGNDFYCEEIRAHFYEHPTEETKRIIASWLFLTERSYSLHHDKKDLEKSELCEFLGSYPWKKSLKAIQLLKYCECIRYNIEETELDQPRECLRGTTDQEKKDIKILDTLILELRKAIVQRLDEYESAKWSSV